MIKTKQTNIQFSHLIAIVVSGFAFAGCATETAEDQKISAALSCIDKATDAKTVDTCTALVAGVQTTKADLIRCSGHFIAQGLTGSRLANAFQQQNNGSTESNPTTTMAAYLVFNPNLTGHTASDTLTDCTASGVKSAMGLAALVQVASTLATLAGSLPTNLDPSSVSFDRTAIQSQVNTLISNLNSGDATAVAQVTAIGAAASTAQGAYCSAGSTLATQDVCTKLNSAIGSSGNDPANIGKSLLSLLKKSG